MAIIAALVAVVVFCNIDSYKEKGKLSDLMLDNVETLVEYEADNGGKCPKPYDVYNRQLEHVQRTARATIDANLEFTIAQKKFKVVEFKIGATINVTYELGNCDKESPGNCCPDSRNGEINIISKSAS